MDWCLGVVCLVALITAAQACCEPTSYTFSYAGTISGSFNAAGDEIRFEGNYIASGVVDYLNSNAREIVSGIVKIDHEESEIPPIPFIVDVGINDGKKLWVKTEMPTFATAKERCLAWDIKGGIPKDYQCITDYYKKTSDNTYAAPTQNDTVSETITVTDECIVQSTNINLNFGNGAIIKMSAQLTEYDLSDDPLENLNMPADCQTVGDEIELPQLDENSPGLASMIISVVPHLNKKRRSFSKRTLINEGLKRLTRHIEEAVKRAR